MKTMKRIVVAAAVATGMWAVAEAQYTAYIWEVQHPGTISSEAQPLITALRAEVDKILAAGHLAPLRFSGADIVNEGFWLYYEPGRVITTLAYAYPYLTSAQQALVRTYVNNELATAAYAPWASGNRMDPAAGTRREWFSMSQMWQWGWMLYDVRFYNLYGLWLYAYNSGDWAVVSNNWSAIQSYYTSNSGQGNIYGTVAGHIAMARMANRMGNASLATTAANNATTVFNDGLNVATMHTRQQSYFSRRYDSLQGRSLASCNWFFMNMSPEVGRYMYDFIRSTAIARHTAFLSNFPHWFVYRPWYGGGWTGHESQGATPEIIGMAMPIERWVLRRSGQDLFSRYYIQYACHGIGDCYAIEAIVMNISAYGTDTWYDVRTTTFPAPIVIGGNAPTAVITAPVSGSTYTAPATVNIAATASDSDGSVVVVRFYQGATLLGQDSSSPYTFIWSAVPAGTYSLTAQAQDNDGMTGTSGVVGIVVSSAGIPNQPPVTALVSPPNNSTYTAPAGITLTATATDADGTIAAVRFYSGTTLLNLDNASPYTYTWMGVSSGTYQLYATATDNQGAVSTSAVANVTVYPPNQPPAVSLTSPVNNSTWTAPANITLTATATDPDGSVSTVRFYSGATLLNTDAASPWTFMWTGVSSGTYQLRAVAQDNQGATSTSTIITVTVLSSSTPAVWYTLTATANPANGGTVTPASGTYLAGSQIQVTATPNANYTFTTWSGDASGTNPTVTHTMDSDKNITANFTYVPPANSSPTVSITSPQDGATFTAPASITITATATDSDGSIAAVRFYSGTTQLGVDSTSPYSFTWTGVGAGSYFLTAQAEDNQGAVGTSAVVGITVNAQPVYYTLTVSANPATGGTVALNPPPSGSGYLAGTQVAVTATPNAGYVFTGWSGNASGTNPTITLMMDGDKTVTAQFTPVTSNVTLTVTANPANAGTIALNPPGGSYVPGTAVTVTATPSQGYVFSGWSGGVVSTANPLNVTVTANMNLVANFITAPSTGTTPDVQPGTVRIVGGLDGYVNTAYENSVSVFFQPRRAGTVYIRVYSLNGRLVREGVVMSAMPGTVSSFSWDLRNNDGTAVSAGVYIVYVKGGGLEIKKKIVVLH